MLDREGGKKGLNFVGVGAYITLMLAEYEPTLNIAHNETTLASFR